MSKVQEGLEPWLFEGCDRETYVAERKQERTAKKAETKERSRISPQRYWGECLELKKVVMRYVSVKKLARNVMDPAKRHNVKHVVDKYYGGRDSQVFSAVEDVRTLVERRARLFNRMCLENDVDQIDVDTLIYYLSISGNSEKFDRHIKKHRDDGHPPFPLDELPAHDFRKAP